MGTSGLRLQVNKEDIVLVRQVRRVIAALPRLVHVLRKTRTEKQVRARLAASFAQKASRRPRARRARHGASAETSEADGLDAHQHVG